MQLAGANAWLPRPIPAYQRYCLCIVCQVLLLTMAGLVVRLPTDAKMEASPCHAYAFEAPLREDLPEGFFTMRTP